jgi:hypothetical protein
VNIWDYDRSTGELLGQNVADPDPEREGGWLIPAFSTKIRPPVVSPGCVAVFDGGLSGEGSWRVELKVNDDARQRALPHVARLATVINRCFRSDDLDRETATRLILEAAATTVKRLDDEGLRTDAIALTQDMLGTQRAN